MKLIEDQDNWIVKLSGQEDLQRKLVFNKKELQVIRDAIDICEKSESLLYEHYTENEFGWAVIYLNQILELYAEGL